MNRNKTTDTNQASEDVVDSILSTLGIVDRKSGNRPGQTQVVKQIIRTEKLKLLDEVRERVVGEHKPKTRGLTQNPNNAAYWTKASRAEFDLIEEQLAALTKLEAEL